jgi:hypothetical protein
LSILIPSVIVLIFSNNHRASNLPRTFFALSHGKVAVNSEVLRSVTFAELHFVSKIFIVKLCINSHQDCQTLADFAIFLSFEEHVLRQKHQIMMQVIGDLTWVKWLKKDFNHVAEAYH